MARIWITIDVEAQPTRAPDSHVSRLIWGRFEGHEGAFGVGRMMDVADLHEVGLTMFLDFAETDLYGAEMEAVCAEILRRRHDLQLHVHSEFFRPEIWKAAGIAPIVDLTQVSIEQARLIVGEIVRRHRALSGVAPASFRGGGYRFNENLLRALGEAGVRIDSSVNRSRATQPFPTPPTKQFLWPSGLLEIPVGVVDGFRRISRPFDFNFNTAHFPGAEDMLAYVEHFEAQYGPEAVATLVLHSWSLLEAHDGASGKHFGPPLERSVERFDRFLGKARENHEFVTTPDLVRLMEDGGLKLDPPLDPRGKGPAFWGLSPAAFSPEPPPPPEPPPEPPLSLRRDLTRAPLRPLEEFAYPWRDSPKFRQAMEAMLAGRWEKSGHFVTDMRPPIDFDGHARPHAADLHSWEPAGYALQAHEAFADKRYLDLACGYVFEWLERYWRPVSGDLSPQALDRLIDDDSSFAWYDMAVGRRIYRLAYLLDLLARDPAIPEERLAALWEAVQFHHAILEREHFFRIGSNHGIHQALGQLAAARRFLHRPESPAQYALGRERLLLLLDRHFTAEGVHKEHSPGYHYGLIASFIGAAESDLLTGKDLQNRVRGMEKALSWMIAPGGRIAPIGDTDPKPMTRSLAFAERFADPGLRHQLSGGRIGEPPKPGVAAFPESGYAFAKLRPSGAGEEVEPAYLAQIAAFHSPTHKHADHLGFLWRDRGRDLLIDPGRYAYEGRTAPDSDLFKAGFWYSDPKRIYLESTRAHNCVEIDGASYPRRGARFWGSGLRAAREQEGLAVFDSEATHFRSVRHRRVLVMAPGRFLLALDWLFDRVEAHDYRQWLQFAPEWRLEAREDRVLARAPARDGLPEETLSVFNLIEENRFAAPLRGQETPQLQGWISEAAYAFAPSGSLAVEALSRPMARFATLCLFGEAAQVVPGSAQFNASMRNGALRWRDAEGEHLLRLTLGEPGEAAAALRSGEKA